jgi:hypothetical protein
MTRVARRNLRCEDAGEQSQTPASRRCSAARQGDPVSVEPRSGSLDRTGGSNDEWPEQPALAICIVSSTEDKKADRAEHDPGSEEERKELIRTVPECGEHGHTSTTTPPRRPRGVKGRLAATGASLHPRSRRPPRRTCPTQESCGRARRAPSPYAVRGSPRCAVCAARAP